MSSSVPIDEHLLLQMLASPTDRRRGFEYLVRAYSQPIYWHLRRMVHNHDDAHDLAQNTFLKAWEAIDGFRGEAKVSTWLYRIAIYEGLNFLRRQTKQSEHVIDPADEVMVDYMMSRLEADEYFDGDEVEKRFQRALVSLPEKQQLVFRLRYYDEMPYEQIAQLTGTSVGALKASYHHAANKVKEALSRED